MAPMLLERPAASTWEGFGEAEKGLENFFLPLSAAKPAAVEPKQATSSAASSIIDLFESQVEQTPHAPAVHHEHSEPQSFADFNKLVNQIVEALSLRAGTIVPICMDPSVEFAATVIAVLKSGAAYTILDPAGAPDRNRFIAAEGDSEVVIVDERYAAPFEQAVSIESIIAKISAEQITGEARNKPYIDRSSRAYIVYTSGSTGTPKGVVVTHGAALAGIQSFSLNGKARWLLFFNPIFSAAQRTILATLSKGGCLCLARRDRLTTSLKDTIEKMQIDALGITPSTLALLPADDVPRSLRQITTVGEPASSTLIDLWADKVVLRVSYGLSECAQLNFSTQVHKGSNPRNVGKPSDTTTAYLLQPGTTELVAQGEKGELCLAGPQLADGYLKRPEQTAERFIKNPFGEGRMYRTGDLALQHENGTFEIVGRIDNQIKIYGQRLEPGEVSAVLAKNHGVVASGVVAAVVDGEKSLVAAIVPAEDVEWSALVKELREQARAALPSYMVPSYWLHLDALPTNPNGKVVPALITKAAEETPKMDMLGRAAHHSLSEEDRVVEEVEVQIRDAWSEVLGMAAESIGRQDTFIHLGGSSIQAIRIINDLRRVGILLELPDLLGPNNLSQIRGRVNLVDPDSVDDDGPVRVAPFSLIKDESVAASLSSDRNIEDAYPLTALQEEFFSAILRGNQIYLYRRFWNVSHLDIDRLKLAFKMVFSLYPIYRTTVIQTEAGLIQTARRDVTLPWKEYEMSLPEYEDLDRSIPVELGSLMFRMALINRETLVVSMHHTIFDFWAHRFLYEDVARLYSGLDLVPRPAYTNLIHHHQQVDKEAEDAFWKPYLAEAPPTILNHAPPAGRRWTGQHLPINLDKAAAPLGLTTATLIDTAWALVLTHHTGQTDVTWSMLISGRDVPVKDVERVNGPALLVIPQRLKVDTNTTLREIMQAVSTDFWEVLKHGRVGLTESLAAAGHKQGHIDTLINILVRDTEDPDFQKEVFKQHGPRQISQTEFSMMEAQANGDGYDFRLTTDIEEDRAQLIVDQTANTVRALIEQPDLPFSQLKF
ncbi:acetyl-CoA synthetase-like protein [Xylona heveae TC161]|uniref:Acetyl-CoA synthetase-like protein n=1 Tax=Xylona heveae (strain CBS 132557 / TC161) TaxID=1328760 RepID=A0A165J807_XYLHT|nr:acetyl-CoA synthetase-like protein [Xylona heveae TC161]KZF25871.1 acetyl-CoA synthetase-like protein [Xylona heveae TC161]